MPDLIKKEVKDPYMFKVVENVIDDAVDDVWPEVEEELIYQMKYKIDSFEPYPVEPFNPNCCSMFCVYPRAWWNYTRFPYNKSIWQ